MSWSVKSAESNQDLDSCRQIMSRIYQENPSYWPFGLDVGQLDGGCWLVKNAAQQDVGFVGWQVRHRGGKKIGYYCVGVLPEFRGQHIGKQAVSALITKKAAEVDQVRAMILEHNEPSKRLAGSIGIPVDTIKTATAGRILKGLGWGLGNAATMAGVQGAVRYNMSDKPDKSFLHEAFYPGPEAIPMHALNMFLGARHGAGRGSFGAKAQRTISDSIVKDVLLGAASGIPKATRDFSRFADSQANGLTQQDMLKYLGGAGLLSALGAVGAAYMSNKGEKQRAEQAANSGRIRVTLPTRNPGDKETTLDMPIQDINLSQTLRGGIRRDLLRRLRAETGSRKKSKNLPSEQEEQSFLENAVI